jgi:hypothetical protein
LFDGKIFKVETLLKIAERKKILLRVSTKTGLVLFWREFDGL